MARDGKVTFEMFEAELLSRGAADVGGKAEYKLVNTNGQMKGANKN